ncbi:hypothetical protein [Nocardia sp. NPDC058705]|uniref:hypothetical protein n=1 Tax=Nocardia sp. NPDC058705 TaxID=3346609 RepID=UPI0036BE39CF
MAAFGRRLVGAAATVAVAAVVNIAASILTDNRTAGWAAFGVVLLVLGIIVQIWLTAPPSEPTRSEQHLRNADIGGSAEIGSSHAVSQVVTDVKITGDLNMNQGGN